MSKKIIYLLSLLMALSLVFASCKKSNPMDALGNQDGPPSTGENDQNADSDTGLYDKSDSMPNDQEFIRRDALFNGSQNGNYYRNPVVVAGRDGAVFIFFEIRYERAGAVNDVGIDGNGKVDIAYIVSKNSGKDKFNNKTIKYVNKDGAVTTETNKSHGAPIVYYIKDNGNEANKDKIVVVASAGSGFGRTTSTILEKTPSKVEYIVGTFTDKTTITWSTDWKEITDPNIKTTVESIKVGSTYGTDTMKQFGTHSHRGVITSENKLILPLVVAQQGTTDPGPGKELMGVYVLEGSLGSDNNTVTWKEPTSAVKVGYDGDKSSSYPTFGQWKASEAVPTSAGYDVLTVPSPVGRANNFTLGQHTTGGTVTPINGLPASEGSFGYLLTDKWYGATSYETNKMTSQTPMILYSHVQKQESTLTLHILNASRSKVGSLELGSTGKSSSIDMLPDGTVIIAAENTKDGSGYYMYFERRSQAQLARLAQ